MPCLEAPGNVHSPPNLNAGRTKPKIVVSTIINILQEVRKQSSDALTMRDFDGLVEGCAVKPTRLTR